MFYIQTLDAHELHGPFTARSRAYTYAEKLNMKSFRVLPDVSCQNLHDPGSLRLVPTEYR